MSEDFDSKRRQRFLGEDYFDWRLILLDENIDYWSHHIAPTGSTEEERLALTQRYLTSDIYRRFLLKFTGGGGIELMRDELGSVIAAYERYTAAERLSQHNASEPPLVFAEIGEYEVVMQLIGFCYLLHRRDLLPRIAEMLDAAYRGTDTLYEDLLAYELEGRINIDSWHHDVPYRPLVFSLYRESKPEALDDISEYLDAWYQGMEKAPWHDGHLEARKDGKGTYVGYWAVEAAAVAYLLQLDDSPLREHLLYPTGLADFARNFDSSKAALPTLQDIGAKTVRTGQICPETGIWNAQGHNVPGVLVQQGERMPDVFAPDKTGAHRPQSALWEFERKA